MRKETQSSLINVVQAKLTESQEELIRLRGNISDYTSGGPLRSEKTELNAMRLSEGIHAKALDNLRVLLGSLENAPQNLDEISDWAEIELLFPNEDETETVLLLPNGVEGIQVDGLVMTSIDSPLGRSLNGHKTSDRVIFEVNGDSMSIEIKSVC